MFATVEDTFKYIDQIPDGNLMEFGVYHADTLERLCKRKHFEQVWGLDSFCGLPKNNEGNPDWVESAFNVCKDKGFKSIKEAKKYIIERVGRTDLNLIEGWFEDTLTKDLGWQLYDSCSYAHIDCDLFSSSLTCLEWLFKYNVMKEGCLIRFDDWHTYAEYHCEQPKAYALTVAKYQPMISRVFQNVFILDGYAI